MVELSDGLLKLDFTQYLIRHPHIPATPRSFRQFQNSRRDHRFKDWPSLNYLHNLNYCLNCHRRGTSENPITTDHMIPQVLTRPSDIFHQQLRTAVVAKRHNQFSLCRECHTGIDSQKIPSLNGPLVAPTPGQLFYFLTHNYPITNGDYRLSMLFAAQVSVDRYIQIIESHQNHSDIPLTALKPFIDSLPDAYMFSGSLYRRIQQLYSELDARYADLVQSVA